MLPDCFGDSSKRFAQVVELQQKLAAAEERARQLEAAQTQLKERLAQAEQGLEVRLELCAMALLWPLTSSNRHAFCTMSGHQPHWRSCSSSLQGICSAWTSTAGLGCSLNAALMVACGNAGGAGAPEGGAG